MYGSKFEECSFAHPTGHVPFSVSQNGLAACCPGGGGEGGGEWSLLKSTDDLLTAVCVLLFLLNGI